MEMLIAALSSVVVLPSIAAADQPHAKPYMPGVRIDWRAKQVELDAEVALDEGMLELLACRPQRKEHESILRIDANAVHVYQALRLLGAEPGTSPYWDDVRQRVVPPTGHRLRVCVRTFDNKGHQEVDAHQWVWDDHRNRPAECLHWVFSGGLAGDRQQGQAAEEEGTVISLVDFASSLVSLDRSHSEDDTALWLRPNKKLVPPVGTRCVVIIKVLEKRLIHIRVDQYGAAVLEGQQIGRVELLRIVRSLSESSEPSTIELHVDSNALSTDVNVILTDIVRSGIERQDVDVRHTAAASMGFDQGDLMRYLGIVDRDGPLSSVAGALESLRDILVWTTTPSEKQQPRSNTGLTSDDGF